MCRLKLLVFCAIALLVAACDRGPVSPDPRTSAPVFQDRDDTGTHDDSGDRDGDDDGDVADGDHSPTWPEDRDVKQLAKFTKIPVTPEQASASIGPEGGSVALDGFEIVVPPGAVSHPTRFKIRRPVDRFKHQFVLAELEPHNVTFAVPVVVRFPLADTDVDSDPNATITRWDGEQWQQVVSLPIEGGARLEAVVDHLSYWGVWDGELGSGGDQLIEDLPRLNP